MEDLDFRRFLTTYGVSYEEYKNMNIEQQQELIHRFDMLIKAEKQDQVTSGISSCGQALQGCGCSIMLLPVVVVLLFIAFSLIFSLF